MKSRRVYRACIWWMNEWIYFIYVAYRIISCSRPITATVHIKRQQFSIHASIVMRTWCVRTNLSGHLPSPPYAPVRKMPILTDPPPPRCVRNIWMAPNPYLPIPCSPIPYSPIPCSPNPYSPITCSPIPYSPIPCSSIPYSPIPCSTNPYSPIPCLPISYSPITIIFFSSANQFIVDIIYILFKFQFALQICKFVICLFKHTWEQRFFLKKSSFMPNMDFEFGKFLPKLYE